MRQIVRAAAVAALLSGAGHAPATAAEGSATADNVGVISINTDNGVAISVTIPHVAATGTPLTDAELETLFSVGDSSSLVERLQRLTAASIAMPESMSMKTSVPSYESRRQRRHQSIRLNEPIPRRLPKSPPAIRA
ncbi:MAG TPA: hypothetical protein VG271_13310 [Beijerinckiaceae bacterium]|nr:hypothetical protein [Beijerinckiaceae bacterium]